MLNLNFTPFPTITTQRLVLRQLQDDDVHELFALRTDERVNRFLDRPLPQSLNDVREFIEKINQITHHNEGLYWVITRKNEDKLLGTIGLRNFEPEQYRVCALMNSQFVNETFNCKYIGTKRYRTP